jgi:bromodomain-containing protein 7
MEVWITGKVSYAIQLNSHLQLLTNNVAEDPFTILQALVPEPLSKPLLTPLYPITQDSLVSPPVQVSLKHKFPEVSSALTEPSPKRRHWSINRQPIRSKTRDNEDNEVIPSSKVLREPQATDFAPFSTLMSDLTEEHGSQAVHEEAKLFDTLRTSLQQPPSYVESSRAEAEDYIQDIVYGGPEGLAYLWSLSEFINSDSNLTVGPSGMTVSKFVEDSIVDNITQGRHRILQETINHLCDSDSKQDGKTDVQDLLPILTEKIDLACLLRNPNELLQVENEWSGPAYKTDRRRMLELEKELSLTAANGILTDPAEYLAFAIESHMQNEGDAAAEEPDDADVFEHVLGQSKKTLGEMLQSNLNIKEESLTMRALRMDLLALAKRVPVDQIAFT